jgi:hypothetical protein
VLPSSSALISLELPRPSSALLYQMLSQAHRRGSSTEPRNLAISLPVSKLDSNTDRKSFVRAFHIKPFNARGVKDCTHGCQCSYKMRYIPSSKYLRTTDAAIPCLGGPCSRPMLTISTSHPHRLSLRIPSDLEDCNSGLLHLPIRVIPAKSLHSPLAELCGPGWSTTRVLGTLGWPSRSPVSVL